MQKKRVLGIDLARAISVIGMFIVNFKIVFGDKGPPYLERISSFFDGKASATFVVLAGIGLALMNKSAIGENLRQKRIKFKQTILKRSIFLALVGLSYYTIWPADILHYYAIYMLIALLFINSSNSLLIGFVTAGIILYPALLFFIPYENHWDFTTLNYIGFWTPAGFLNNLFVNGFHPVFPWISFLFLGIWFGRKDLSNSLFIKKSLCISFVSFILIYLISRYVIQIQDNGVSLLNGQLSELLSYSPMPPLPFYMISACLFSISMICASILLAKHFENSPIIRQLSNMGKLALTFYILHVILGMGIVEAIYPQEIGHLSLEFTLVYTLLFGLFCIIVGNIWLLLFKQGPLELIMRKICG